LGRRLSPLAAVLIATDQVERLGAENVCFVKGDGQGEALLIAQVGRPFLNAALIHVGP
jgi:hypothetical protein